MALFNRFPYSNTHELNLDWILDQLKNLHITQDDMQMIMDIAANFSGNVWPTVKSYGAAGDGVTNDSQAILDCMDDNDIVIFPEGRYYLGSQIEEVSRQNKVWIGWPRATIIFTDPPETEQGYHAESWWKETAKQIRQQWEIVKDPDDVDPAEAFEFLFGGES